ncbi:hypothetical protein M407DRAFT_47089, partial [Tulasnella calospora MUT 4182]
MGVWSSLRHENILKFTGYYIERDFKTAYLLSPYMLNGNAQTYLATKQSTMDERLSLLCDTMNGLNYLHNLQPPVVHGNLKAANVLINDNRRAVLSDLGLSALTETPEVTERPHPVSLVRWLSPELLRVRERTTKSDVWAWGCLALELVTRDIPYLYIQNEDQIKAAMSARRRDRLTPEAFHELDDIPDVLVQLLRRCWNFDFAQRPNAEECMDTVSSLL